MVAYRKEKKDERRWKKEDGRKKKEEGRRKDERKKRICMKERNKERKDDRR